MADEAQLAAPQVIRGNRVVTPDLIGPAAIQIQSGRIIRVTAVDDVPPGVPITEAGDLVITPGLVDTHVHINEPGRTEWEGFTTATRAAAAGGVTSLIDMPLNSIPPTTTLEGLRVKQEAARDQVWVDVGFWGGVVPGNTGELGPMHDAGIFGFKCFLVPSGVDEFAHVEVPDLHQAMPRLRELDSRLLVHAELPGPIDEAALRQAASNPDPRRYRTFLESRPRSAENDAIALMIELCRNHRTRTHIVHLSSSDAIPMLAEALHDGLPMTAETCSHYLHFTAEEIRDGATEFKCCPPIREQENRELLWQALKDRVLGMVVSDHSPCTPLLKCGDTGDFAKAWGGISSVQLGLPVFWTEARNRGLGLRDLVRWMCEETARFAGLNGRKGAIAAGHDADLVLWDPDAAFELRPEAILHRHSLTPYRGQTLYGAVHKTYLRGQLVYEAGKVVEKPAGRLLRRGDA